MKSWKKRWERELDEKIPALREDVRNAEIPRCVKAEKRKKIGFFARVSALLAKRRWVTALSACACALVLVCFSVVLLRPNQPITAEKGEVIAVEINPRAAFVLDSQDNITAVRSLNADADVILNNEERLAQIQGKPAEEGIRIYVDYAARLGYLDLSTENAVRITSEEQTDSAERVNQSLSAYFQEKGAYIAVVEETLSETDFTKRLGLTLSEVKNSLAETLEGWTELFSVRGAEGQSKDGLQMLYRTIVFVDDGEATRVENLLCENLDKIQQNEVDIKEIDALNDEIKAHEGNPGRSWLSYLLSDDYWDLKEKDRGEDEEFLALTAQMDEKLAAYEQSYGKRLESREDMEEVLSNFNGFTAADLAELLSNFTADIFRRWLAQFAHFLEAVGVDTSFLSLHEEPTDLKSYLEKTTTYLQTKFDDLLAANQAAYEAERTELSDAAYEEYTQSLAKEYGSLSAYWAALKK